MQLGPLYLESCHIHQLRFVPRLPQLSCVDTCQDSGVIISLLLVSGMLDEDMYLFLKIKLVLWCIGIRSLFNEAAKKFCIFLNIYIYVIRTDGNGSSNYNLK